MDTPNEYSVGIRPIQLYHHSILDGLSGGPMDTPNEYSVGIRPIQLYHHSILDGLSGGPMYKPNEYPVGIRLIRWYHPANIGWTVRRTNGYTQQILSGYLAYLIVSPTQYWMAYYADH